MPVELTVAERQATSSQNVNRKHGLVFPVSEERMRAARESAAGRSTHEDIDRAGVELAEDQVDRMANELACDALPLVDDAVENHGCLLSTRRSPARKGRSRQAGE